MEDLDIEKTILEIRQKLVLRMNGVVAENMKSHGIVYRLNYGVSVPELKEIAASYDSDSRLAMELWRQECRECRMLGAMLYPADRFCAEMADIWIPSIEYPDLADVCCKFLFRNMNDAAGNAFRWIASDNEMFQYCGFMTMAHLLREGREMREKYVFELRDQAEEAVASDRVLSRQGASAALSMFEQYYGGVK